MIENVITRGMWALSSNDDLVFHSTTIHINTNTSRPPRVTAEIALSRVMGSGAAKAYIWSFQQQPNWTSTEPLTVPLEPPASGLLQSMIVGNSQYSLNNVTSVTFGLFVSNMFANATCMVFIHQSRALLDVLLWPVRYLEEMVNGRTLDPGQTQGHSQTAVVYVKETGRIVHIHQNTWMQGAVIPAESLIRSSALALTTRQSANDPSDLEVLIISEELSPQYNYSVDVREKRLIAS